MKYKYSDEVLLEHALSNKKLSFSVENLDTFQQLWKFLKNTYSIKADSKPNLYLNTKYYYLYYFTIKISKISYSETYFQGLTDKLGITSQANPYQTSFHHSIIISFLVLPLSLTSLGYIFSLASCII